LLDIAKHGEGQYRKIGPRITVVEVVLGGPIDPATNHGLYYKRSQANAPQGGIGFRYGSAAEIKIDGKGLLSFLQYGKSTSQIDTLELLNLPLRALASRLKYSLTTCLRALSFCAGGGLAVETHVDHRLMMSGYSQMFNTEASSNDDAQLHTDGHHRSTATLSHAFVDPLGRMATQVGNRDVLICPVLPCVL